MIRVLKRKRNHTKSLDGNLLPIPNNKQFFDEFERRTNTDFTMYISFMEIYNEQAFDLLDKRNLEVEAKD